MKSASKKYVFSKSKKSKKESFRNARKEASKYKWNVGFKSAAFSYGGNAYV